MADSGHPPAELHERLLICRTIKLNAGAHGGHRRCCHAQMQKNAQNKPQIARLILCVHTTLQVYCNLFLTFCRKSEKICANVWESCTVSRFEQLENVGLGGKQSVKIRFGVFRADEQMRCFGSGGIRCGNRGSRRVEGAVAVGSLCIGG